jgi:carotenoid cleavage dioxygenase-like enzyme
MRVAPCTSSTPTAMRTRSFSLALSGGCRSQPDMALPVRWTLTWHCDGRGTQRDPGRASRRVPALRRALYRRPYRHAFHAFENPPRRDASAVFAVVHLNLATGWIEEAPEGDALSKAAFLPRAPDARKGEGRLLAVQYVARENRSFVAQDAPHGPAARAMLSHRVSEGSMAPGSRANGPPWPRSGQVKPAPGLAGHPCFLGRCCRLRRRQGWH